MSQNRTNKQSDSRSQLDLQINLLAEQESTKMLQMLCGHHKLDLSDEGELEKLLQNTEPQQLLKELKDNLPEEC